MIELVGFDGDDTLWHSEGYFHAAHAEFERLLGRYIDLADARVHERLLATEQGNMHLFGYGAKGITADLTEICQELKESYLVGEKNGLPAMDDAAAGEVLAETIGRLTDQGSFTRR